MIRSTTPRTSTGASRHGWGLKIGVPEEVAWRRGLIDDAALEACVAKPGKSWYGDYPLTLLGHDFEDPYR